MANIMDCGPAHLRTETVQMGKLLVLVNGQSDNCSKKDGHNLVPGALITNRVIKVLLL